MPILQENFEKLKRAKIKQAAQNDPQLLTALLMDEENIPELQKSVNLATLHFDKRDNQLKDIQKLISEMLLKTCKQSVKVQTVEAVWNGIPETMKYEYFQYGESSGEEVDAVED